MDDDLEKLSRRELIHALRNARQVARSATYIMERSVEAALRHMPEGWLVCMFQPSPRTWRATARKGDKHVMTDTFVNINLAMDHLLQLVQLENGDDYCRTSDSATHT